MVTGPLGERALALLDMAVCWWVDQHAFRFVDLPWVVPERYTAATRPADRPDVLTPYGAFVGSGEQSFLYLWSEGRLPSGPVGYIGWTPCLRAEPVLDELHHFGFMKAELFMPIAPNGDGWAWLNWMLARQRALFELLADHLGYPRSAFSREVVEPAVQIDLVLNGIEVGSYGLRRFGTVHYVYGTALALPRFTQALAQTTAHTDQ